MNFPKKYLLRTLQLIFIVGANNNNNLSEEKFRWTPDVVVIRLAKAVESFSPSIRNVLLMKQMRRKTKKYRILKINLQFVHKLHNEKYTFRDFLPLKLLLSILNSSPEY